VITPIELLAGHYADTDTTGRGCFMDVASYLNGDDIITDHSPCVCPVVRQFVVWLNDYMNDDERGALLPFIERAMHTGWHDSLIIDKRVIDERAVHRADLLSKFVFQRFGVPFFEGANNNLDRADIFLRDVQEHIRMIVNQCNENYYYQVPVFGARWIKIERMEAEQRKKFANFRARLIVDALHLLDAMLPVLEERKRLHHLEAVAA